jgi:hypothetical protein
MLAQVRGKGNEEKLPGKGKCMSLHSALRAPVGMTAVF